MDNRKDYPPYYGEKYFPQQPPIYPAQQNQPPYPSSYPATTTTYPSATPYPAQMGWFENNQKNKPQSNSVGAAALVFTSGGMCVAWSVGFELNSWYLTDHMLASWFIGAILGALAGAVLTNFLQKKLLYAFSSTLVIISGILFAACAFNYDAILAARYLNGFANGIAVVTCLVMAGEEAVKELRGMITGSVEAMCFSLGIYTQVLVVSIYKYSPYPGFGPAELLGVLHCFYGFLGLLLSCLLVIESPVWFLIRNQEQQAIDSLRRLQRPFVVTQETIARLEELKRYVSLNKAMSLSESCVAGLPALLKMCIYRGLAAMSFTLALNVCFLDSVIGSSNDMMWTAIVYSTFRWVGSLSTGFIMDRAGRKLPLLFGLLICGALAIGIGVIFYDRFELTSTKSEIALIMFFAYQFFAGIYITPISTYLCEAFPLTVKSTYIAFAFIVECLIQIIVIVTIQSSFNMERDYMITLGVLSIAFSILGYFWLPETKHVPIVDAQEKFSRFWNA